MAADTLCVCSTTPARRGTQTLTVSTTAISSIRSTLSPHHHHHHLQRETKLSLRHRA